MNAYQTVFDPSHFCEATNSLLETLGSQIHSGIRSFLTECSIIGNLDLQEDVKATGLRSLLRTRFRWSPFKTTMHLTVFQHLYQFSVDGLEFCNFTDLRVIYYAASHAKRLSKKGMNPTEAAHQALEIFAPFDLESSRCVPLDRDQAEHLHNRYKLAADGELDIEPTERTVIALPSGSDSGAAERITNGLIRFAEISGLGNDQAVERVGEMLQTFDFQVLQTLTICAEDGLHTIQDLVRVASDVLEGRSRQ